MEFIENDTPKPRKTSRILILLILFLCAALLIGLALPILIDIKPMTLPTPTLIKNLEKPLKSYADNNPFGMYPEASFEQDGNGTSILVYELVANEYFQFHDSNLTRLKPSQLVDEWGNPMRYHPWKGKQACGFVRSSANTADSQGFVEKAHNVDSYDLWSAGADGEFGTADDITNWAYSVDE